MGEFFDTYKRNKNPPQTHICVIMLLHVMLVVVIDRMRMITWCVICCWNVTDDKTYLITGCTICCAKCQFHPFLPVSSITMPPSWKMLLI